MGLGLALFALLLSLLATLFMWMRLQAVRRARPDGSGHGQGADSTGAKAETASEVMASDLACAGTSALPGGVAGGCAGELADAREELQLYKQSFLVARAGIFHVGLNGRFLLVNEGLCAMLKRSREDLLQTTFQAITHPDDRERDVAILRRLQQGDIAHYTIEKRYIDGQGGVVKAILSVGLARDSQGAPQHFIAVVQDVSDLQRYREFFAHAEVCLAMLDPQGRFLEANAQLAALLGVADGALKGRHILEVVPPEDRPLRQQRLQALAHGVLNHFSEEARLVRADGTVLWGILGMTKVLGETPETPWRYVVSLQDITSRKSAEQRLQRSVAELALSNRELDNFASVISHDLREPLRGIRNYAAFLMKKNEAILDPKSWNKLHSTASMATRMESQLLDLLRLSRFGRVELQCAQVDMQALLAEVLENLAQQLEDRGVEARLPAPLPHVLGDRSLLLELLQNLISNAIRYAAQENPWVEIGCVAESPAVFYVKDNGIGIAEKHHHLIFEPFKRLHGKSAYGGGSGVGLAVAKRAVERHQGKLWVESQLGRGSTFYFSLGEDVACRGEDV